MTDAGRRSLLVAGIGDRLGVRQLRLVAPEGGPLPSYTPGAHVVIQAGEHANAYSLTGPFLDPDAYEVSVLRIADGRGGSRWLHDRVEVGDRLTVTTPRSAFAPVATARHHLLIAGGIGVTPILAHVRGALTFGRSFEVLYAHRPERPVHRAALEELCGPQRLTAVTGRAELRADLAHRLAGRPLGTHVYVCGPPEMIELVRTLATDLGWPAQRIHSEAFGTPALDPGEPFEAVVDDGRRRIAVPAGVSLLDALSDSGIEVPNMCRQGVCGECRIPVSSGTLEHRDLYLSDEERQAGDTMLCCVSRARGGVVELAL